MSHSNDFFQLYKTLKDNRATGATANDKLFMKTVYESGIEKQTHEGTRSKTVSSDIAALNELNET